MGRQRGIVHLSGQFDDTQLSIDGKKGVAKLLVPITKERVRTADEFLQTRKVNMEFKAASLAVDTLQECLCDHGSAFGNRYLRSRLQTLLIEAVRSGTGRKGERSLEVLANLTQLHKFPLNEEDRFKGWFKAPMDVQVNPDRNTVTLVVPAFDMQSGKLRVPLKATQFRIFVCAGVLSDLVFSSSDGRYEPANPQLNGLNVEATTPWMTTVGHNAGFQIVATLPGLPILPSSSGLVVSVGVEYCDLVSSNVELRAQGNAMDILDVY